MQQEWDTKEREGRWECLLSELSLNQMQLNIVCDQYIKKSWDVLVIESMNED